MAHMHCMRGKNSPTWTGGSFDTSLCHFPTDYIEYIKLVANHTRNTHQDMQWPLPNWTGHSQDSISNVLFLVRNASVSFL